MAQWLGSSLLEPWHPGNLAGRCVGAHIYSQGGDGRSERGVRGLRRVSKKFPSHPAPTLGGRRVNKPKCEGKTGGGSFHAQGQVRPGMQLG